jgi:Domain of unknown function (DUF929)
MSNKHPRSSAQPQKRDQTKTQGPSRGSGAREKPGASPRTGAAGRRFAERQERRLQAAAEARRARNRRYGFVTIGLVLGIVALLVIVKVATSGGTSGSASGDVPSPPRGTPIPTATLTKLSSVPVKTLNSAPTGTLISAPQSISGKPLTSHGLPELLSIFAEFCPHCGGERWPVYIALSKFGTFDTQPGHIHSATQDGNIPTFSFYGTRYSSPYFTFTPVEVYTNYLNSSGTGYVVLQTPTPAQLQLWQQGNQGSFPYMNFGGKALLTEAQFDAAPMENLSFDTVAAQVGNNTTVIGSTIDAAASQLIKTMCATLTHDQPAAVCGP